MSSSHDGNVPSSAAMPSDNLTIGAHSVLIDGLVQRYHVAGQGPVCIAHSGGPGISWDYLRMPEVEHDLTVIYIEPVGTGASGRLADPRGYTLDRYAYQIDALITQLGLDQPYLLGHSHSGFIAQRYALDDRERLAGLILYDTSPTTTEAFLTDMGEQLNRVAERHANAPWVTDTMAAWQEIFTIPDGHHLSDDHLTSLLHRMLPVYFADYSGLRDTLDPMFEKMRLFEGPSHGEEPAPFDVQDQLASITIPTLVIVGQYDPVCSLRWSKALHEGIPGSELVVFEQSGHFAHVEEPGAFAEAIRRWLTATRQGAQ